MRRGGRLRSESHYLIREVLKKIALRKTSPPWRGELRKINASGNWGGLMPNEQKVQVCPSLPQGKLVTKMHPQNNSGVSYKMLKLLKKINVI